MLHINIKIFCRIEDMLAR